jgi:hypothetical protein
MEQIDFSNSEDITLFTDEEQVAVKTVNHEFSQRSKLKGLSYEFMIFNDIQCYQSIERKHGRKFRYRVNLSLLDPRPVRRFKLSEFGLFGAGILAVLSFLLAYAGWFSNLSLPSNIMMPLTVLMVTACLLTLMMTLLKSEDRMLFFSHYGRVPVLQLINRNPNRKDFDAFMQLLSQHIIRAQHQSGNSMTDLLTRELKELRRLKDEEVIEEARYEKAKQRIFRNKAFKSNGSQG